MDISPLIKKYLQIPLQQLLDDWGKGWNQLSLCQQIALVQSTAFECQARYTQYVQLSETPEDSAKFAFDFLELRRDLMAIQRWNKISD